MDIQPIPIPLLIAAVVALWTIACLAYFWWGRKPDRQVDALLGALLGAGIIAVLAIAGAIEWGLSA